MFSILNNYLTITLANTNPIAISPKPTKNHFKPNVAENIKKPIISGIDVSFNRVSFVFFVFVIITLIYSLKIVYLASIDNENYFVNNSYTKSIKTRQDIVDRNGNILAKTVTFYDAAIRPELILDKKKLLINLKMIFPSLDIRDIRKKMNDEKYFYIKQGYLRFILNIDLFISNVVCDVFTKNSIKIYMHHDIHDTPLVSDRKEKELFQRLIKYDYLFISSRKSKIMFHNFFKKYNFDFKNKIPKLMESGYVKLDYLRKNIDSEKIIKRNSIVIAPTNPLAFEKLSMFNYLDELIDILLRNIKSEIIFRPHPSNRKEKKVIEIEKKFNKNPNFNLDISDNYSNIYLKSYCLITDLSGTAYTYAFLTKKPVIFFSKNEKLINNLGYNKLAYFEDREKIGIVIQNLSEIIYTVKNIKFIEKKIKNSIDLLEKDLSNLGNSKNRIKQLINEIKK